MKRFVRPQADPKKTATMLAIAIVLMVFLKTMSIKPEPITQPEKNIAPEIEFVPVAPQKSPKHENILDIAPPQKAEEPTPQEEPKTELEEPAPEKQTEAVTPNLEKWREFAIPTPITPEGFAKIVIIIDDLGMNHKNTRAIVDLPAPLTLAYLPYAPSVKKQAKKAREAGHELLIHTPMEPMSDKVDPGPLALLDAMDIETLDQKLDEIFAAFDGYIGINNHMGSRLTQNEGAMRHVMQRLADRGLVFVDSKTSPRSVAEDFAAKQGLYHATRDIFLDHESTPEFVAEALEKVEEHARKYGTAIAIGHPKTVTIEALRAWLPTLKKKRLVVVPVSSVLVAS